VVVFEKFLAVYTSIGGAPAHVPPLTVGGVDVRGWRELLGTHGGASFADGVYRLCRVDELRPWTFAAVRAFPDWNGKILCFGYDWLGRFYAIDTTRRRREQPLTVTLDPTTGEVYPSKSDFVKFHEIELVEYPEDTLASEQFDAWRASNPPLDYESCVGLKVPLFMGGTFTPANFEVIDLDVYWTLTAQLMHGNAD
jgi:T6SS immunity protein Tdi1, C-terminal